MILSESLLGALRAHLSSENRSHRTVENYVREIRRLERVLGDLLDPAAADRIATWRDGQVELYRNKEVSASSIVVALAALRAFYRTPAVRSITRTDYTANVKSIGTPRGLPRPMPVELIERLFAVLSAATSQPEGLRDHVMCELYLHGLRNEEVCRLRTDSIIIDGASVSIRVFGKGNKFREIPLNGSTAERLALHLLETHAPQQYPKWLEELAADGVAENDRWLRALQLLLERVLYGRKLPLFTTKTGAAPTRRWSDKRFAFYRNKAGIKGNYGPHSLRHSCATEMLDRGEQLVTIKEILGHEKLETTMIYTKVSKGRMSSATARLPIPMSAAVQLKVEREAAHVA